MNCIILSALIASALFGVSTANPACALAPLAPKIFGAINANCGTSCGLGADAADCPANACTVAATLGAAVQAAAPIVPPQVAAQGEIAILGAVVSMVPCITLDMVIAAKYNPTGPQAAAARNCMIFFAAFLDSNCSN